MKKSILKCVTCFLALIFLLSATVGCANSDTSDDTGVNTSDGEVTTECNVNDMDTLGEYDFGGAKYRILARESTVGEFDSTVKTYGDTVSQAVFTREVNIEERFNVDIEVDKIGCRKCGIMNKRCFLKIYFYLLFLHIRTSNYISLSQP